MSILAKLPETDVDEVDSSLDISKLPNNAQSRAHSFSVFRPEAVEGLRSREGRPVPLFGLKSWMIVLFMTIVLLGVLVFLFTSNFARKETVEGLLQPEAGSATISYSRPGTVTEIYVREGQTVAKGQRLLKISVDTALDHDSDTLGVRVAHANDLQAAELASELYAAKSSGAAQREQFVSRASGTRTQIAHLTESLALQRQRLALGKETLDGLLQLQAKGFVSVMRVRDKQVENLATEQTIADLDRQIDQAHADLIATQATAEQSQADAARSLAQLRGSQAALAERRAQADAESSVVLIAPYAGRLVTVRATTGSAVEPGAALATVLPRDTKLEAVLWVPSRSIGFVSRGDEVRLMLDAFPFQQFGTRRGVVSSISSTPVEAKDVPVKDLTRDEALYRVRVSMQAQSVDAYGKTWPLSPGSRLQADLILQRQTLFDWILDPLQAFRKRSA